jgi:hypothetical protein
MLHIKGLCVIGTRTVWHTDGDGDFFCPGCGGDRGYRCRTGRRRLTILGFPLLPRGSAGTVVECVGCLARFAPAVLEQPTNTLFSAMLRDAVHTVALALLTAGGAAGAPARSAAVHAVRSAGFADCTEDQLLGLLAAIVADEGRFPGAADDWGQDGLADALDDCGSPLSIELREALEPLARHLAPQGRERVLLQGARIALADGPYLPAERETLMAVGRCLGIGCDEVTRVLEAAARTPS